MLRLGEHPALRDGVLDDLGLVDNLLDKGRHVNDPEGIHKLVHHQRHRIIENRDKHGGLDDPLSGVPLYLVLRTRHVYEPVWSGAPPKLRHAVVVVEVVVPRAGLLVVGFLPELGRVELLVPTRSCPSSDTLKCGAFSRTGPWRR